MDSPRCVCLLVGFAQPSNQKFGEPCNYIDIAFFFGFLTFTQVNNFETDNLCYWSDIAPLTEIYLDWDILRMRYWLCKCLQKSQLNSSPVSKLEAIPTLLSLSYFQQILQAFFSQIMEHFIFATSDNFSCRRCQLCPKRSNKAYSALKPKNWGNRFVYFSPHCSVWLLASFLPPFLLYFPPSPKSGVYLKFSTSSLSIPDTNSHKSASCLT